MGIRGRLRRLEQAIEEEVVTLLCPECAEKFTLYGDPAVEFLVHEWSRDYGGETHRRPTDPAVVKLSEHEHDPSRFVDAATGEPWLGGFFAGNVRMPDGVPNLSE